MDNLITKIYDFLKDEDGLTIAEYAVSGSLISAAVVLSFTELGDQVGTVIDSITTAMGGTPTP